MDEMPGFDEGQQKALAQIWPQVLIGPAGCGKTMLALEKLSRLAGHLAYISLSQFLVDRSSQIYFSQKKFTSNQDIEFLSLNDYVNSWQSPGGSAMTFREFSYWIKKYQGNFDPLQVYEEFRGVLTGADTTVPYISFNKYFSLGIKQSLFERSEREKVYRVFKDYLSWITENNFYDINILCFNYLGKLRLRYDFIVIDEVQDFTNIQMKFVLDSLKRKSDFVLAGDSHQVLHSNFFSWSKIKTFFQESGESLPAPHIFVKNYRNSFSVLEKGNLLLKIKSNRFGSIDRESSYIAEATGNTPGEISLYPDDDKKKTELNNLTEESKNYAVIVPEDLHKSDASAFFKTPLIFSIREAKGLEYENVILLNFVSFYGDEFTEIVGGIFPTEVLEQEITYNRASSKNDKSGELLKFYINSLYVAITRATGNLYFFEKDPAHAMFQLLSINETDKPLKLEKEISAKEEWLSEATRLEKLGSTDQAEKIRSKYSGQEYLEPAELAELLALALDPLRKQEEVKKERKQLFQYALHHQRFDWIEKLATLQFPRAVLQLKEFRQERKEFAKNIRLGRSNDVLPVIEKYEIDFISENGETALMLALFHGCDELVHQLLKLQPRLDHIDGKGWMAVDHLLRGYFERLLLKHQQVATLHTVQQFWSLVCPPAITLDAWSTRLKIGKNSFLFHLLIIMRTMQDRQKEKHQITWTGISRPSILAGSFSVDELITLINLLPDEVIPLAARDRSFVSQLLSENELAQREDPTCKPLFQRMAEERYIINPDISWIS